MQDDHLQQIRLFMCDIKPVNDAVKDPDICFGKACMARRDGQCVTNLVLMAARSDIMLGGEHHKVDAAVVKRVPEWRVLMPAVVFNTVLSHI